jgi:hypothetical protein
MSTRESWDQGDLIGRFFAYWAIVYYGQVLFENYRSSQTIWAAFFHGKS